MNSLSHFLLPATGLLSDLSVLEQVLACVLVAVFILGAWAIFSLSFTLMQIQKARLLDKYTDAELATVGVDAVAMRQPWWKTALEKLTDRVPQEREDDILLDHDYDGVQELDNNLPPWWKGVFYLSIAFAPLYIYFTHFSDYAKSSAEAYVIEMETAEEDIKAFLATQENAVDESNVTLLAEAEALNKGEMIYNTKCSVCHGKAGEGGIGPNLTDKYWLHGGDITDVFRTIKHGVPEKGMIPWKNELRPRDMQEVASYILSLVGSNPPNAKEPQGELYVANAPQGEEPTKK
ncbi:MAG: cbb3-type cytochrome c oxidase N-terminal domain-containing protein [Bacteroidota bacterium]